MLDPEAAKAAHEAGAGATLELALGGHLDPDVSGAPIECVARVVNVSDGEFKLTGPLGTGETQRLGPAALLQIGGVDVIVVSERSQTFDEGIFRLHGLDVRDYQVVGVKSSTHFRAGFAPIVEECGGVILTADEPGLSTNRLEVFEAQRTVASGLGPMWPVDGAAVYEKALAEARL